MKNYTAIQFPHTQTFTLQILNVHLLK